MLYFRDFQLAMCCNYSGKRGGYPQKEQGKLKNSGNERGKPCKTKLELKDTWYGKSVSLLILLLQNALPINKGKKLHFCACVA